MKFEFVIPTYNRPNQLMMAIHSIYSQTADNWKISVVADAPYNGLEKIMNYFTGDDRISFTILEGGPHNDWGHTPRIHGMMNATEEWLVMTGDDNYYLPCFLDAFNYFVDDNTNFIFCDLLHNYGNYVPGRSELRKIGNRYEGLDIGCYATRTKLAQTIKFRRELHWADGQFAADYWSTHCREQGNIKKIDGIYYIHN